MRIWIQSNSHQIRFCFVARAWLDASGEKELIREPIDAWLKVHATALEAGFVYKSWLDAGGEKEIVKEYIPPWLKKFPLEFETRFVIDSLSALFVFIFSRIHKRENTLIFPLAWLD
ncbi:MAG: hypothetical protein HGA42_09215 [Nostocales cyanobacterium W4_Combined_metabat2_030]|nr:hypothetical protein [Nostocales cyanobacterium W4_Combined_metabat2_030]